MKKEVLVEWFLRISFSIGFLSAVADRFGLWYKEVSAWGNWASFVKYTNSLLPFLDYNAASIVGGIATFFEVGLGLALLTKFKTSQIAICSGILLFTFGLSMTIFLNVKAPLDYSVYTASAAAFALSLLAAQNKKI